MQIGHAHSCVTADAGAAEATHRQPASDAQEACAAPDRAATREAADHADQPQQQQAQPNQQEGTLAIRTDPRSNGDGEGDNAAGRGSGQAGLRRQGGNGEGNENAAAARRRRSSGARLQEAAAGAVAASPAAPGGNAQQPAGSPAEEPVVVYVAYTVACTVKVAYMLHLHHESRNWCAGEDPYGILPMPLKMVSGPTLTEWACFMKNQIGASSTECGLQMQIERELG